MTKTLQELRVERRALVEQLIRELDSLAGGQSRSVSLLTGYAAKLDSKTWTAHDLDEISLAGDRIVSYVAGSDVVIDRMVVEIRRISAEITLHKASQPIDPPPGIGDVDPPQPGVRPGEDLDWGVAPRPDDIDIDWIIEGDKITSTWDHTPADGVGTAYRLSRARGIAIPVFGVKGRATVSAAVGGQYGQFGTGELMYPGDSEASATFVGMTDDASIRLGWGSHFTNAQDTGEVRVYDLGLRGSPDGHLMNAAHGGRVVQLDGCWYVHHNPDHDYAGTTAWQWPHSISMGSVGTLVIRNHKWRGEKPSDPGMRFLYYSVAYVHGQTESFLFENNDCRGGGRGGHQNRPDAMPYGNPSPFPRPTARVMYRGNTHTSDGPGGDGGQCVGAWSALGGLYVYDNDFEDFPFTGVMTSGQNTVQNYPTPSGNQIPFLHFAGNRIIPGPNTRRASINLSSIDTVHIYDDNEVEGSVEFDAKWNWERNGSMIGEILVHSDTVPEWMRGAKHYDPGKAKTVLYTNAELTAMLVSQ